MRLLGIPDPPELRETPRPNRKAARSRDTCNRNFMSGVSKQLHLTFAVSFTVIR